ncbi:MAG: MFS transporter, partial [Hyphomonadaceae bacterium]
GATVAAAFSWRSAFLVVGALGVATALEVWLVVRDPKRGGLDRDAAPAGSDAAPAGLWATCRMFFRNPVLFRVSIACAATQLVTYGVLNFTTLFLMREKGMTLSEVALWYALLIGTFVSAGMYVSGRLVDRLALRSKTAYAYVPAFALILAVPLFVGFVWAPSWPLALAFLALPTALNYFYLSPAVALVQEEVRPNQRVLSGALLLLVMNLVGLGLGPTYVGFVSDYFRPTHPENSLKLAFYALLPFYALAIALFFWLARALKAHDSAEAQA